MSRQITLYSQRTGNKTIKVTPSVGDSGKCYTWSRYGNSTAQNTLQKYACTGCRSIYNKDGSIHGPLPYLVFDVVSDTCDNLIPSNRHFCQPLNIKDICGLEIRRQELAKVKETREKPSTVLLRIADQVATKYAICGDDLIQAVKDAAIANPNATKKAASRVAHLPKME